MAHPWLSVVTQLLTALPACSTSSLTAAAGSAAPAPHTLLTVTLLEMSSHNGKKSPLLLPSNC